jgi:hypothetical protein
MVHAVDLWRTAAELTGAQEALADPLEPLDSIGFAGVLRHPDSAGERSEVFTQAFVAPGPYLPTELGPYEPGCPDPTVPGLYACTPRNVGAHGRTLSDGRYKLIVVMTTPGAEGAPPGSPDEPPDYIEFLFDLLLDPAETSDLMPLVSGEPALAAVHDRLRERMTRLSGF